VRASTIAFHAFEKPFCYMYKFANATAYLLTGMKKTGIYYYQVAQKCLYTWFARLYQTTWPLSCSDLCFVLLPEENTGRLGGGSECSYF
jgi:hypothetical protein